MSGPPSLPSPTPPPPPPPDSAPRRRGWPRLTDERGRRSLVAALLALVALSEAFAAPLPPGRGGRRRGGGVPLSPRGGADAVARRGGGTDATSLRVSASATRHDSVGGSDAEEGDGAGSSAASSAPSSPRLPLEGFRSPFAPPSSSSLDEEYDTTSEEDAGGDPLISAPPPPSVDSPHLASAATPSAGNSATAPLTLLNGGAVPVEYVAETDLPTDVGHFRLRAYRIPPSALGGPPGAEFRRMGMGTEPCVIYCTDKPPFGIRSGAGAGTGTGTGIRTVKGAEGVPVRIHDQCFTSEVFRSQRCDCKEQLKMALEYIQRNGGAIIYLQQEGRGIGLANKVAAYALQDIGMDTVDANIHLGFPEDCRQYGVVPSILEDMGIRSVRLMTNNPRKLERMRALGVEVDGTVPMVVDAPTAHNRRYLETKRERMNHANFGDMLARTAPANGAMASRRAGPGPRAAPPAASAIAGPISATPPALVAERYINEGEEMAAAAVASALLEEGDGLLLRGVTASEDGYCFGRRSVEDAIAAVGRGEMVVVVDDMDRENEGDFIMAADMATPEAMAKIVRYSSGVICVAMEGERMDELDLPAMVTDNEDPKGTAFSVTVDASRKHGVTTGISALDRSVTLRLLASPRCRPDDLCRPGHIFPLRARPGGVLSRDGHTEAAVDLCRLAGRYPAGVLCEIVSEDDPTGMARLPELRRFCETHGYVLTSIVDIAQYRRDTGE